MSEIKTIENVHVEIYGNEMLSEIITRARKNNIPYDRELKYDFHSHGHSYLVLKDGELTLLEDPSEKHGEEISLNGFFELYLAKEEVKKELEVGKWYFGELDNERKTLFCFNGEYGLFTQYGFNVKGEWSNQIGCIEGLKYTEATPQEVEKALIEEAKRRYKVGYKLSKVHDDYSKGDRIFSLNLSHQSGLCDLWIDNDGDRGHSSCIFKNGQWATIIEQENPAEVTDKFAELKEAHSKGAEIQFYDNNRKCWFDCGIPCWNPKFKYRIKPEEKPKVGDVCKFWCEKDDTFTVGILEEIDDEGYFWCSNYCYPNAKTLTQQEAIELLFKSK